MFRYQKEASTSGLVKTFINEGSNSFRFSNLIKTGLPLEFALFYDNEEANYQGYERVRIERKARNFKISITGGKTTITLIEPVDFPAVKGVPRCPCCGNYSTAYINNFAVFLGGKIVFEGYLTPAIVLGKAVTPRIRDASFEVYT